MSFTVQASRVFTLLFVGSIFLLGSISAQASPKYVACEAAARAAALSELLSDIRLAGVDLPSSRPQEQLMEVQAGSFYAVVEAGRLYVVHTARAADKTCKVVGDAKYVE